MFRTKEGLYVSVKEGEGGKQLVVIARDGRERVEPWAADKVVDRVKTLCALDESDHRLAALRFAVGFRGFP